MNAPHNFTPNLSSGIQYDLKLPEILEEQISDVAVLHSDDDAREIVERAATLAFLAKYGIPFSDAQRQVAHHEVMSAQKRLKRLLDTHAKTDELVPNSEPISRDEISRFDKAIGYLAGFVLGCITFTVPVIAAIGIYEAEQYAVFSEVPIFSIVFGMAPFAGILSAAMWRKHMKTDQAREKFDKSVQAATVIALVIWAILAALTAYPIGGEGADDGYRSTETQGFSLTVAPAVLLVWTTILDLVAASALHQMVKDKLFPTRPTEPDRHPDVCKLEDELVPEARREGDKHTRVLAEIDQALSRYQDAKSSFIRSALLKLSAAQMKVKAAKSAAVASLLS